MALGTRLGVNLSRKSDFDDNFEDLVRQLHEAPPPSKPPLGQSPFVIESTPTEIGSVLASTDATGVAAIYLSPSNNPTTTYTTALDLARRGDIVVWRRLLREMKAPVGDSMVQWRKRREQALPKMKDELPEFAREACGIYAQLMAIALAGIESGDRKFSRQQSLLDDILSPPNWSMAGYTLIADIPATVAFLFQALHGAMCVSTEQIGLAEELARMPVFYRNADSSLPLFKRHEMIAWPGGLGGDSRNSWAFLLDIALHWDWLAEPFGDLLSFQTSLVAYYQLLSIIELADLLTTSEAELLAGDHPERIRIDIPIHFAAIGEQVCTRASSKLLGLRDDVRSIWRAQGIADAAFASAWTPWAKVHAYWHEQTFPFSDGIGSYGSLGANLSK